MPSARALRSMALCPKFSRTALRRQGPGSPEMGDLRRAFSQRTAVAVAPASAQIQHESVVLLFGVSAQEALTITQLMRESGPGPFSTARVVRLEREHLDLTLAEVLAMKVGSEGGSVQEAASENRRIMMMFGDAAIDEDAHEVFLDKLDEEDNSILIVPAVRDPTMLLANMVQQLFAAHDAAWQLKTPLETNDSCTWDPSTLTVALNLEIDGAFVRSRALSDHGALERWDTGRLVVLDGFLDESERVALLEQLTKPGFDPNQPPPADKWEPSLSDLPGLPETLGLRPAVLEQLCNQPSEAVLEVQSRLAKLYPEYDVCRMPESVRDLRAVGFRV